MGVENETFYVFFLTFQYKSCFYFRILLIEIDCCMLRYRFRDQITDTYMYIQFNEFFVCKLLFPETENNLDIL